MRLLILLLCLACATHNAQTTPYTHEAISYGDTAVKILEDDTVVSGKDEIVKFYQNHPISIEEAKTLFQVAANQQFQYEIGAFTSEGEHYKQVVITDTKNTNTRVFEFITRASTLDDYRADIDRRRAQWISLCNQHNAQNLINTLYTENTIYYNHRPVVKTREALIPVYQYMNNPQYSLQLTPLHVELVNATTAFEIGQCSGSYNGKYILIWEKADDGEWYVKIDSNI